MPLAVNTYGSVPGVEGLVGDIASSRVFSTATIPSLIVVESLIDQVAAEINIHLQANGYIVPVSEAVDPVAHNLLVHANNAGAAALLLATGPMDAWTQPGGDDISRGRQNTFENLLSRTLAMINERRFPATRSVLGFENLISGSQLDALGNTRKPIFTLQGFDYPGTRSLSE